MMPSWWWKTSSAGWPKECRRAMRVARQWTKSPGRSIAIALVLCAVFVPTAFMAGISGQFYKQFAFTIAASTIISAFNSLNAESRPLLRCCSNRTDTASTDMSNRKRYPARALRLSAVSSPISSCWLRSANLFGIEIGGHGHGGAEAAAHTSAAILWALRAGVFVSAEQSWVGSPAS